MPKFRTPLYAIWKACERFKLLPPDIQPNWEDNNVEGRANLLAYSQIRETEEMENPLKGLF